MVTGWDGEIVNRIHVRLDSYLLCIRHASPPAIHFIPRAPADRESWGIGNARHQSDILQTVPCQLIAMNTWTRE